MDKKKSSGVVDRKIENATTKHQDNQNEQSKREKQMSTAQKMVPVLIVISVSLAIILIATLIAFFQLKADDKQNSKTLEAVYASSYFSMVDGSKNIANFDNLTARPMSLVSIFLLLSPKMYVSNLFTQPGETDDFKVSDHIKVIEKYINHIDVVIANSKSIPYKTRQKYSREEEKDMVKVDKNEIEKMNKKLISDKLNVFSKEDGTIKHDSLKTSYLIFSYLMDEV